MSTSFEYKKPPENQEHVHKIEMVIDGDVIGHADLEYRNDPFPFYYVSLVFIKKTFRGSGFGREVLEKINGFLDSKKKPGILANAIDIDHPAHQMYEKCGWIKIQDKEDWYSYGLDNLNPNKIKKAVYITEERDSKKYAKTSVSVHK